MGTVSAVLSLLAVCMVGAGLSFAVLFVSRPSGRRVALAVVIAALPGCLIIGSDALEDFQESRRTPHALFARCFSDDESEVIGNLRFFDDLRLSNSVGMSFDASPTAAAALVANNSFQELKTGSQASFSSADLSTQFESSNWRKAKVFYRKLPERTDVYLLIEASGKSCVAIEVW